MSVINDKGAIRSCLAGVGDLPVEMTLFEVIDNREHSNSKSVFIDFDIHNKKMVIGFSESATISQIENMVKWYNITDTHYDGGKIATRASGIKLYEYTVRGDYYHVSCSNNNTYFESYTNTTKIYNSAIDSDKSDKDFSEILYRETQFAREKDQVIQTFEDIFKNKNNSYPFSPKTIIYASKISNNDFMNYISDKENQENLIKKLRIKHYAEIYKEKLELYIKFPNEDFNRVSIDEYIDVIGNANHFTNKHNTNIYILNDIGIPFYLEHNNKFYYITKNGNSYLRKKLEDINKINLLKARGQPDFILEQYNTYVITSDQKKNSIVGGSLEHYAGLYINIGDVFISSEKVKWNVTDRNLSGNKNYRCVLKVISNEAKSYIGLNGLKALFDLTTKPLLHTIIKSLTDIYKKYINCGKPSDPDKYFIVESTAQKTESDKKLEGYFYICNLGENFYKLGEFANRERIFDYNNDKKISDLRKEFPDEIIYEKPTVIFPILDKIINIKLKEQEIKCFINDCDNCITYDAIGGDIREYFHCDKFYEIVLPEIKKIIEN